MNINHPNFTNAAKLVSRVDAYFKYIEGEFHIEYKPGKAAGSPVEPVKVFNRAAEPPTIAGLTLFLGFNSRQEFDEYETNGVYAFVLKRAQLRIETEYEKKLHYQSPTGAMFALKNMGWHERTDAKPTTHAMPQNLTIEIIESGPKPVSTEQDVIL